MYRMYLVLGDWSDDGHGKTDKILVETTHPVEEVRQAYKDSCKLTGVTFCGDYTEVKRDWKDARKYCIANDYEDSTISEVSLSIFEEHGCPLVDDIKNNDRHLNEGLYIPLWMWFISLSLTDFTYTCVTDDVPVINGYWHEELNAGFGYGLYT